MASRSNMSTSCHYDNAALTSANDLSPWEGRMHIRSVDLFLNLRNKRLSSPFLSRVRQYIISLRSIYDLLLFNPWPSYIETFWLKNLHLEKPEVKKKLMYYLKYDTIWLREFCFSGPDLFLTDSSDQNCVAVLPKVGIITALTVNPILTIVLYSQPSNGSVQPVNKTNIRANTNLMPVQY